MYFVKPSKTPRLGDKKVIAEQALLAVLERPLHVERFTHQTIYPGESITVVGVDLELVGEWVGVREVRLANAAGAIATVNEEVYY